MPGPLPKPPDRRHRAARPAIVIGPRTRAVKIPPAPGGLLRATLESWESFWSSALARLVDPETDLPAIRRLFTLQDERERALRSYTKRRLVEGSMGQPVINPAFRQVPRWDAEIRALEDRFGLTPASRFRLGIALGDAARSLEDLNAGLDVDGDDGARDDPRLSLVSGGRRRSRRRSATSSADGGRDA